MNTVDHLILGYGYTASYLKKMLQDQCPQQSIVATSRSQSDLLTFDLDDSTTWDQLPRAQVTYWTFPPEPFVEVRSFIEKYQSQLGRIVVIGSTSGFLTQQEGERVTEGSSLDLSKERVKAESYLSKIGAMVVMSSGIYGPNKNPINWIEKGLVGKSSKIVNMIHVEDLCQFIYQAGQVGKAGQMYIASDNCPLTWQEVIDEWESNGLVKDVQDKSSPRTSKIIDSSFSIEELKISIKHRNFAKVVSQGLLESN